jgi:DNA-binding GntR family transcriptional regulator
VTAYQRIADSLRQRLLAGHWKPGEQLPTERELGRQFAASQITVRHALQILEQERLVERRQGSGTYAGAAARRKIPILNGDFCGSIKSHAPQLERVLHTWEWGEADADLSEPLQMCVGDSVLKAVRVDKLDGEPVMLDEVFLVQPFSDRLTEADLAMVDFVDRWQVVQGIHFGHYTQTIEAAKAKPPVSRLLQIRVGEPVLKETSVLFVAGGRPAGLFVSYYRHDTFRFDVTVDFPERPSRGGDRG